MPIRTLPIASLLSLLLSACVNEEINQKIVVSWPARGTVYVADTRTGTLLALAGSDSGRLLAQAHRSVRTPIIDMQLDAGNERLWVLGTTRLDIHEARSLDLKKSIPLDSFNAASLQLDSHGIRLYSRNGNLLGRIEGKT